MTAPSLNDELNCEIVWPVRRLRGETTLVGNLTNAIAVGVGFWILCVAGNLLTYNHQHIAVVWAANGVLTAFLLLSSSGSWKWLLLAAWIGNLAAGLWLHRPLLLGASIACANVTEAGSAAFLLRRVFAQASDLVSSRAMVSFLGLAVVMAPVASGLLAAAGYFAAYRVSVTGTFVQWIPSHSLGMAIFMPFVLALSDPNLRRVFSSGRIARTVGILLLVFVISIAIFEQTHFALRFIYLPLLMLVAVEAGILGAVVSILEISIVGAFYILRSHVPLWMERGASIPGHILLLQCAMLVLLISVVPFAAVLERQRQLQTCLRQQVEMYRLLADNSRDIVVLANLDGRRLYVSPAVQQTLGWSREEWTDRDSVEFMHPDDVPAFRRLLREMLRGKDSEEFRYRTLHKDGKYMWMEANLRVLPDKATGKPAAFVANIRDVSLRVDAEQKLAAAHHLVEMQAQRDSLTELANRRRFDDILEKEWRRGRRTGSPLTLLMVDIDRFKRINDTFGHRAGDACLRSLAAILGKFARRPGDAATRYGGDEFALLLPDVNEASAATIADSLCMKVREQAFQIGVGRAIALTVSVGIATQVPDQNTRADGLVEAADKALYAAKQEGRNRAAGSFVAENRLPASFST